jgi:hypothetical protein
MSVTVLEREIFSEAEAARLLRVAQGTLHYWLNGGQRRGRTYPPVIRAAPHDGRVVTWAEFVEAGLLRGYRRDLQVPMVEVRAFVDLLRARFEIPYPLAHARPYVGEGKQLVWDAQEEAQLDPNFGLIAAVRGQLVKPFEPGPGATGAAEGVHALRRQPKAWLGAPIRAPHQNLRQEPERVHVQAVESLGGAHRSMEVLVMAPFRSREITIPAAKSDQGPPRP